MTDAVMLPAQSKRLERLDFERWAEGEGFSLFWSPEEDDYWNDTTRAAYKGWMAGHSRQVKELK